MDANKIPYWPDVKDDPEMRLEYHNAGFQIALEALEEITKAMLVKHDGNHYITGQVGWIRQMADSMVKCFNQLYYDVNQGFPGHTHAIWFKNEECGNWIYDSRYVYEFNELIKHKGINNIHDLRKFVDEQKEVDNLK